MSARFWGFRPSTTGHSSEFVMLANWNGSGSRRRFDAETGRRISYDTSGGVPFEQAYGGIHGECREVCAPTGFRTETVNLGPEFLRELQSQVGIEHAPDRVPKYSDEGSRKGMLWGVPEIFKTKLGLHDPLESKSAAAKLSQQSSAADGVALIGSMYDRIERNWDRSPCRSTQLWRWEAKVAISGHNSSPEKTLEKAIVNESGDWVNQIPAASGLLQELRGAADERRPRTARWPGSL